MRIGHGYDVHRLVAGRDLILGGIKINHRMGLDGHSDADVVLHAICDSLLGALSLGDIGSHFPDSDPQFKGIDSRVLLRKVAEKVTTSRWRLANLDITIVAQAPKLAPFIKQMRINIAEDLQSTVDQINIKATTTEMLGFAGREEGVAAHAVCLLEELK
jgi:2-C-methyl-D-erythritol 2,4-cyclodiphosphate synthase